jgi:hypothetical protein
MTALTAGNEVSPIRVMTSGTTVVLAVCRCLDAGAGQALTAAASAAVEAGAQRIDVDLQELAAFTADGTASLVACRDIASAIPEGLHYRTGRGPGRDALLAAYSTRGASEPDPA